MSQSVRTEGDRVDVPRAWADLRSSDCVDMLAHMNDQQALREELAALVGPPVRPEPSHHNISAFSKEEMAAIVVALGGPEVTERLER